MKRMIAWFATNHVAANLLMGFAILAGLASLSRIPVILYPDFDLPLIVVTVEYPGAAPEEVESGVCSRIEQRLEGITGIKEIRSISAEGLCTVHVELFIAADRSQTLGEVENQINAIDTFPAETGKPIIVPATANNAVCEVAITGPTNERALEELGRRVRDDILELPGVTHANLANVRPYEISVEVAAASLSRNNLTFDEVAAALRKRSLDLPGGSVKTDQGEILLRTTGQAYSGHELENLVVTTRSDGTRVHLRDVARVVEGFEDTGQGLRFDGKPAALVQVSRVGDQDVRRISASVRRYVAEAPTRYPEGVALTIWRDESAQLAGRLGALFDSGIQGLLLVLLLLALFLRPHLALWVAAGIPIAFLGAIFLIYWFGFSINAISIMGFILALGMLVDNAVVVGESAFVAQRQGAGLLAGAIEGAQQVLVPVTFGVLITAVAFVPLLFDVGTLGQVYGVMAVTVVCCLVFSLIECQMVLPAHLGHGSGSMPLGDFGMALLAVAVVAVFALAPDLRWGSALAAIAAAVLLAAHLSGALGRLGAGFARLQILFESALNKFIDHRFRTLAAAAYRNRALTLAAAFAALLSAASLVAGGRLPFSLHTPQSGDSVTARLTMPMGASAAAMEDAITRLGNSARQVQQQLSQTGDEPPVVHIVEVLGGHFAGRSRVGYPVADTGAHLGTVTMQLTPDEERLITTGEVAAIWRAAAGPIANAVELSFLTARIQRAPTIDIFVSAPDRQKLRAVIATIRAELREFPGVYEIADSLNTGKAEIKLSVTPAGIEHTNGVRHARLTAEVDPTVTSAAAVLARLDAGFLQSTVAAYPGVSYGFEGNRQQSDLVASIGPPFLFALLAIYALIAMPLRSYTQPLVIMSVLPFAFVGALWGHAALQAFGLVQGLSAASLFGAVAASGVVVNSTLVLIHGVNHYRSGGDSLFDALLSAAVSRFRPILITTATIFAGLTPLMLTDSIQVQLMVPLAISVAFGILLCAPAALLVVPALWLVLHDISGGAKRVGGLLGGLLGGAPRLSKWMARYPYIQESLRTREFTDLVLPDDLDLDPETERIARHGLVRLYYEREFDAAEMRAEFGAIAARAALTEKLVREARTWAEQRTFQLGAHMARGVIAPVDAAGPLSDILGTCTAALLSATRREFVEQHGEMPNDRIALVALSAVGRREFATGAPLNLLIVYDHDPVRASAMGPAPDAWHTQLVQRLMLLIRNLSPQGMLYQAVPPYALSRAGGAANACSMQQLRQYCDATAATTDLRMLTHARIIDAEADLAADFETLRQTVLSREQDQDAIAAEIRELRRQSAGRRDARKTWAVERFPGGLDDLELAAEYLQLAGAAPESGVSGLRTTLATAGRRGLLAEEVARQLADAAVLWQNLDGFFRMTCAGTFKPKSTTPEQRETIAEITQTDNLDQLQRLVGETAARTARLLDRLFS